MKLLPISDLSDLATIYLGLAKGADDQFHYRELDLLAEKLEQRASEEARPEVLSVLESVLHNFDQDQRGWSRLVDESLDRLGPKLSDEEKRRFLADLSQIGMADRRFLHAEAAFIKRVMDGWDVRPLKGQPDSWSILGDGGIRGEILRALGVLYLSIAYVPDREIGEKERATILARLGQWIPEASHDDVNLALRDALAVFGSQSPDVVLESSLETVRRLVPVHQYDAIYNDLKLIAKADQVVQIEESTWLRSIGKALGIVSD